MKSRMTLLLLASLFAALDTGEIQAENRGRYFHEGQLRALILTGRNNHDWRASSQFLKQTLIQSRRFDVRMIEEPAGITEHTLSPYDVLILDYQGPRWGEITEQAILGFVQAGKGLVVVHGASYGFSGLDVLADRHVQTGLKEPPWKEYLELIGGIWSEEDPKTAHGSRHTFTVRFRDQTHPIVSGMPSEFRTTDELYHNLKMHPSAHVIATAFSHPETRGTGEEEPILWTVAFGNGRVFHTTLGHDLVAMVEPGFMATFVRGAEWAANGKVSVAADLNLYLPELPRILVVTGGHDFDTAFYSLFTEAWVKWSHAPSNREAFREDIRGAYDGIVLYDMSRELEEAGRRNLREFVESGKGVVVMHHALANYNGWEWWWKEVVGCRYILEGGADPPSRFRHDVEILVRSVASHPITADLGPFRYLEETYGDMWFSPDIRILMKTNAESSDGPVVWVSPYEKSRVVGIQLGHDQHAFRYPGFRELVRRSVLWSVQRLDD